MMIIPSKHCMMEFYSQISHHDDVQSLVSHKKYPENKSLFAVSGLVEWLILEIGVMFSLNETLLSYNMSCHEFIE